MIKTAKIIKKDTQTVVYWTRIVRVKTAGIKTTKCPKNSHDILTFTLYKAAHNLNFL